MTRPSSEPYCRKRRPPLNSYFEKQTSTSPLTNGLRTSSGERNLHHQHRGAMRTNNPTSVGRRGPREEVHAAGPPVSRARGAPCGGERTLDDILDAQCPYHKDMRHTLRNCRNFKHSVGNGRLFQPLPPPPPRGGPGEPRWPQQQEGGGGGAFPRVDGEVNIIFGGHGSQENRRQQKLNDRHILVATTSVPAPYRWLEYLITFSRVDQWLNFDHPGKYPLLVDPVIR
jgi:hypothetical protein